MVVFVCCVSQAPNFIQWTEKAVCYIQLLVWLHAHGSPASIHLPAVIKNAKMGRSETGCAEQGHALIKNRPGWQSFSSRVSMYLGSWSMQNKKNKSSSSWKPAPHQAALRMSHGFWLVLVPILLCFLAEGQFGRGWWNSSVRARPSKKKSRHALFPLETVIDGNQSKTAPKQVKRSSCGKCFAL